MPVTHNTQTEHVQHIHRTPRQLLTKPNTEIHETQNPDIWLSKKDELIPQDIIDTINGDISDDDFT